MSVLAILGIMFLVVLSACVAVAVGYVLGRRSSRSSDDLGHLYRELRELKGYTMEAEQRLKAIEAQLGPAVTSIEAAITSVVESNTNLAGDIQRLTEAVQQGQPTEATLAGLEGLTARVVAAQPALEAAKAALASLAAATPEPVTPPVEPAPTDPPPVDAPPVDPGQ